VALNSTLNLQTIIGWRKSLWKWDIQLKTKIFMWLVAENKILTWKILQHRGWMGLGRCHLCKVASEENEHVFIHCAFTKLIWKKIKSIKNINQNWDGFDLDDCLSNRTKNKSIQTSLVALTC
jgi:hypothetical protein